MNISGNLNVLIIGAGYWGEKFLRNCLNLDWINISGIIESNENKVKSLSIKYNLPNDIFYANLSDFFSLYRDESINLGIVMSPPEFHFEHIQDLANQKINILCAKPLGQNRKEFLNVIDLVKKEGVSLFVDHTFLFANPVRDIRNILKNDTAEIFSFNSNRENVGGYRSDVNVIQDLLIHDLAIIDHLFDSKAKILSVFGKRTLPPDQISYAEVSMILGDTKSVNLISSWHSATKERSVTIKAFKYTILWDDTKAEQKVKVYKLDKALKPFEITISAPLVDTSFYSPSFEGAEAISNELEAISLNIARNVPVPNDLSHILRTYSLLYDILDMVKVNYD